MAERSPFFDEKHLTPSTEEKPRSADILVKTEIDLLKEKYPKACALVEAELGKEGKYDYKFFIDNMPYTQAVQRSKELKYVSDLSEVTLQYLENWDDLEFGVNSPNLKPAILREIIFGDYVFLQNCKNNEVFMAYLDEMNISLEEYASDLQSFVESVMRESQFFRATDHKVLINHILANDERWKSQFETDSSGGFIGQSGRSSVEERFFGFPDHYSDEASTTDKSSPYHVSKRPIYGYFSPDKNGILNETGTQPPKNVTEQYGKVHCKVRESKRNETTVSFGDSLMGLVRLTPATKPHYSSVLHNNSSFKSGWIYEKIFDIGDDGSSVMKQIDVSSLYNLVKRLHYTEAHFNNGLRMSDIESLHVSKGNGVNDSDIEELRQAVNMYNSRHPDSLIKLIVY